MQAFEQRVAVITGGASGIGLAMAERFAAEGMRIVLADIEDAALQAAVHKLEAAGAQAIGVRTDVADWAQMQALAQTTIDTFGKAHIVCNNAGVSILGPLWELSIDDWRWMYDVNFWGVIHGIKAFVPIMREQAEPGRVINTSSLAGFMPVGTHSPYCSSKAAVVSVSDSLRSELNAEDSPIGVSCLCPGMVDTQIHQSWRNRPTGDAPWSDRESSDPEIVATSERIQGSGMPAENVAERVFDATRADRFWIWSGDHALNVIGERMQPLLAGRDPAPIMAVDSFNPARWAQNG